MRLYLAGPLFTAAELEFNTKIAASLRARGHEVFLPQEMEQQNLSAKQIFASDVAGIDWSEAVVANMDGSDPDSGTCWECGYAFHKKPVIVYRTDTRSESGTFGPYNMMLWCSADVVLNCIGLDVEWIARKISTALLLHVR